MFGLANFFADLFDDLKPLNRRRKGERRERRKRDFGHISEKGERGACSRRNQS